MAFDPNVSIRGRYHFAGNSITFFGWYTPLVASINAAIPVPGNTRFGGVATGRAATVTGTPATVAAVPFTPTNINATVHGVPGAYVQDMEADIPGYITSFDPIDYLFIEIGINNTTLGTTPTAFKASLTNILNTVIAAQPGIKIWCMGLVVNGGPSNVAGGELWQDGPPAAFASSNPYNARISDLDQAIQDVVAASPSANVTYVPVRAVALAYEQAHNAPAPGVSAGILTSDGLHPNATGQALMSAQAFGQVTVVA